MNGRISPLPSVILEHLAELLSRNCTEWTLLEYLCRTNPFASQSLVERRARHNYSAQELCLELLKELANRVSLQVIVDALKKLGLLGLAKKISPIAHGEVATQWIYLLSSFEKRNQTNSNSHVILFPNLCDEEIAKIASKMKLEITLADTSDIVDRDKTVGLTIHWLETNTKDLKTTIALVNIHGNMDKAWPMFIRQFGKPPNVSIVQFFEDDENHIVIPQTIATSSSQTKLCNVDQYLIDYWQQNVNGNYCRTHESHAEISTEKSVVPDSSLHAILQHVGDVEDKLLFKVGSKDKEFTLDQLACFLQCWTASDPNINPSRTVIAQMSFDEQYPDQQIAIPTNENGHVILSKFSADDSTIVIFATTSENYWRLWINYPDVKSTYKTQGWTLTSMTPVSTQFVDELRQLDDIPRDLIEALSFFIDGLEKVAININDYLDVEQLDTRIRATTFFRHLGSNSQKELATKDINAALNKAWPKEDYNTKPAKLEALLNFFNIKPSDTTHDGLNNAWKDARQNMQASERERLTLTEEPITAWYGNWLWTTIKKSLQLRTIFVPQRKLIPNILVVNALKQIPDYIILEFSELDINTTTIIDSLINKTIVIKTVAAGPIQLPNPKRNRITVECVQLVDKDISIFKAVLDSYPNARPTVELPDKLIPFTSALIDVCRQISNARANAQSPKKEPSLSANEVGLESYNAEVFSYAYPLVPQPITVQSIINYFDTVKASNMDFTVDYPTISANFIKLSVESVESALQLKKHIIVQEVETRKLVDSENILIAQNKLLIKCSAGKFYSIKRQVSGFAPSSEIIVPTLNVKLPGKIYPDMSQPAKRQIFLENTKNLDASNTTPLCYFCKSPVQDKFELINVVTWAKFEWVSNETVLPVHSQCNTAQNKALLTVVLQPKSFSFPLVIRTLSAEHLLPAVHHYITAAEIMLESKYDNLKVTTVLKMEELEYNMEDEDWRKLSEYFLSLLLTTHEYDIVDKSSVNVNQTPSQTKIAGTYLGQEVYIRATPAKNTIRELFWLRVLKFPSIVQFFGYYYENEHTSYLIFEKLKYDLSAIKLEDIKKDVRLRIARQVCAAMAFLHNKGIVRRSLKPSHILLDEHYNAKLLCSNLQTDLPEVGYSSPEAIKNSDGSLSKESDVYAFGILLLELATIKNAWEGRSNKQIMETIKNGWFPEALRKIDLQSELYNLIAKCLDKESAQRPSFVNIQSLLRNDNLTENFS